MSRKHGRKILDYSIKKEMQVRLLLKVLTIVILGISVMAVIFYSYSYREINGSYRQFHIHAQNFLEYLLPVIISSLLIALIPAVILTIFLPKKIAGPLHRIERDLNEKISRGDLTGRLTVRKGDEVADLANSVNLLVNSLRSKVEKIRNPAEKLNSLITDNMTGKESNFRDLVRELNESCREFRL